MPLRDHFHSPVNDKHRWDAVHGGWPMEIVRTLFDRLPDGYVAEPQVFHGSPFEVDVAAVEIDGRESTFDPRENGGVATLVAREPTLTAQADLSKLDEYEVRIYDVERGRTLVAAIEIVSPANKDRPSTRGHFSHKVATLLRHEVCVTIVDIVTLSQANLYAEFMAFIEKRDPTLSEPPPNLYATTLRTRMPARPRDRAMLDVWFYPLAIGQPLPTVPVWISPERHVELPLEPSYQETCRLLHIA